MVFEFFFKVRLAAVVFAGSVLVGCASGGASTSLGERSINVEEDFRAGKIRLKCGVSCSGKFGANRREMLAFYENESWSLLAERVMQIGYADDHSYFYLARAAEGLNYVDAAKTYYALALATEPKCAGFINVCDGIDVPNEVTRRKEYLASLKAKGDVQVVERAHKTDNRTSVEERNSTHQAEEERKRKANLAEKAEAERKPKVELAENAEAERKRTENLPKSEKADLKGMPQSIDIVGFVPGVTSKSQMPHRGKAGYYEIGGYKIMCAPEFDARVLATLYCSYGKSQYTYDISSGAKHEVSNQEVFATLLKGFTSKFGAPDSLENNQLRTGLGVPYEQIIATWDDPAGNKLILINLDGKIDKGTLYLLSSDRVDDVLERAERSRSNRKF